MRLATVIDGTVGTILLAQLPTIAEAQLPIWVLGGIWVVNQLVNTWLSARQRKLDQDKAGCLGELNECREAMARLEARVQVQDKEIAALYVTLGLKDKQIDHHLAEKKMLLDAHQEIIKQVVDQGRQIGALTVELREAQRHEVRAAADRISRLEQRADSTGSPQAVEVVNTPNNPVPVVPDGNLPAEPG